MSPCVFSSAQEAASRQRIATVMRNGWLVIVATFLAWTEAAPARALEPRRVAVVVTREDGTAALRIAYPYGELEDRAKADLEAAAIAGRWQTSGHQVTADDAGVVAHCRIEATPPGEELTIWPLVYVLRRYDEIAVAYIGPSSPGQGQFENDYVAVTWEANQRGTTYRIRIKNRDFTDPLAPQAPAPPVPRHLPVAHALVVVAALVASALTYVAARRYMGQAGQPGPSTQEGEP
ncbi:MAG: hypothetical protein N2512_15525 [Armatimonadetes bacterium]|nr:hypothetical protein [Armatimonadota bacterium]